MTLLRLDAGAAEVIGAGHAAAAESIDESAGTAPGGVDAGVGSGQILDILTAVSGTAADLAAINHSLAAVVRHIGGEIDGADADVADALGAVGEALR